MDPKKLLYGIKGLLVIIDLLIAVSVYLPKAFL